MRERLDVLDQRRASEVADLARERRLEPWHCPAPFHRFEHRRLLTGDVRAGADHELEREPVEEAGGRSSSIACCRRSTRCRVLLAQVDVALCRLEGAHGDQRRLDHEVGPKLHHIAILDRAGLSLVGVNDHVSRAGLTRDCFPLHAGREPSAAEPREPGRLQLLDDSLEGWHASKELEPAASNVFGEGLVTCPSPTAGPSLVA